MASSADNKLLENPAIREAIDAIFLIDTITADRTQHFVTTITCPVNVGRLIAGLHAVLGATMLVDESKKAWDSSVQTVRDASMNRLLDRSASFLKHAEQTDVRRRITDKYYDAHLCFRQAFELPTATAARKERELWPVAKETPAVLQNTDDTPNRSPKRARNDYCPCAPTSPLEQAKEMPVADEIDSLW